MNAKEFAELVANSAAAEYVRLAVPAPEHETVGMAVLNSSGIRIVVSLEQAETLVETSGALSGDDDEPAVKVCILSAATSMPMTIMRLSRAAGYVYSQWFRDHVNALVDAGQLVRTARGIRRPKSSSSAKQQPVSVS
jgi:hypothetical protein